MVAVDMVVEAMGANTQRLPLLEAHTVEDSVADLKTDVPNVEVEEEAVVAVEGEEVVAFGPYQQLRENVGLEQLV